MEEKKQEDLDMLYVIRSIKKGIANLFKSIFWLLEFSFKKFKFLVIFILGGIAIFVLIQTTQKPYYSSEMSVSHIRFENDYCEMMINNLKSYTKEINDKPMLAKELALSKEEAAKIKKIEYAILNDHLADKFADSTSTILPFKVLVEVYDNSVLDKLQKELLNYLENNEYAVRRKELDKRALEKTEQKIKEEIVKTDSLRDLINQSIIPRGTGNGMIIGEPIDPVGVYKRSLDLYERNLEVNKKQALNNSFELIVGFSKSQKPANEGLIFYILNGFLFGYFVGILWLVRREYSVKT